MGGKDGKKPAAGKGHNLTSEAERKTPSGKGAHGLDRAVQKKQKTKRGLGQKTTVRREEFPPQKKENCFAKLHGKKGVSR